MVTNIIKLIFFIRGFVLNHLIIFFVFLFLFIPFIPRFESIDIIGPQWFIFTLLAFLFLLFFGIQSLKDNVYFSFLYKDKALRLFIVFLFFSIISLFNATNISLSIVELSRFFSVFISIYFFIFFLHKQGQYLINIVLILISTHLFLELIFCYFPLLIEFLNTGSFNATVSQKDFAGIAGNKNIAASSIAIKIPVVIYLLITNNNLIKKLLFSFLLFFAFITLLFLNTRSVFVSTSFVLLLVSLFFIFNFRKHYLSFLIVCIALTAAFYLNISSRISSSQNSLDRIKSIDVSYDGSSGRFELWSNALDFISKNPFFGCGIGNWKIESLPYWKTMMTGYIVPYHAHNDFLELTAEIGVLGGLIYFSFFLFIAYYILYFFKTWFNKDSLLFFIGLSILVYTIDAFFNFPMERPLNQVPFVIFISIVIYYYNFKTLSHD